MASRKNTALADIATIAVLRSIISAIPCSEQRLSGIAATMKDLFLMSSEVKDRGVHLLDETQTPTSYPVF